MAWQKGPLPPDTYHWGGVVPADHEGDGFFFADFCGDHVRIMDGSPRERQRVLRADEVRWWDNALTLPPDSRFHGTTEKPKGVPDGA